MAVLRAVGGRTADGLQFNSLDPQSCGPIRLRETPTPRVARSGLVEAKGCAFPRKRRALPVPSSPPFRTSSILALPDLPSFSEATATSRRSSLLQKHCSSAALHSPLCHPRQIFPMGLTYSLVRVFRGRGGQASALHSGLSAGRARAGAERNDLRARPIRGLDLTE